MVYPALLPLMRTPRLPVVDWTDAPADLNGLVRFAERLNLVSASMPSHFNWSLPLVLISLYTVFRTTVHEIRIWASTDKILELYWPQTMLGPVNNVIFWLISAKQKTARELLNHEHIISMTKLMYRVSGLEAYKNTCLCFSTQKLYAIYVFNSVQSNSKRFLCTSVHFNVGTCCSSTDI